MNAKEFFTHISVTTLLLIFLFACGTLYIISYWTTFDFDITNYIELFDIPKSFVFPLATGLGVSFVSLLLQALLSTPGMIRKAETTQPLKGKLAVRILRLINATNLTPLLVIICMLFYDPHQEWVVIVLGLTLSVWGVINFKNNHRVKSLVPNDRIRLFISILIVFVPIYSVSKGKLDSIAVWKNRNYYEITGVLYTDPASGNKDVIGKKLLGKLGNAIIVTDSSNSNIAVFSLTNVEMVKYRFVKSSGLLSMDR